MRLSIVLLVLSWIQQLDAAENHHFSLSIQKPSAMLCSILFMLVVPGTYHQPVTENHIAPIVADLSIMARLINGIALQSELMHTSQNLNPVLAELLNIGDPNAIPELLKINVSTLSADVQGVLAAVKSIPELTLRQINPEEVKMLRNIDVATLERAAQVNIGELRQKWIDARDLPKSVSNEEFLLAVSHLKYVMKTGDKPGSVEMFGNITALANNANHIKNLFRDLNGKSWDPVWSLNGTKELIKDLTSSAQIIREYEKFVGPLQTLGQAIDDAKTLVNELDSVIKKSQTTSIDNKTLEAIKTAFSIPTDKNPTAGLPNGVSDLKTLFDDLDEKWLKDQFKGKDMNMLVTALEPLKKFYETLKPVDASWSELKKSSEARQVVEDVLRLLEYGKLLKLENLDAQAAASSQCKFKPFPSSTEEHLEKFEGLYQGLDYFYAQLSLFKSVWEPINASPIFAKVETYNWDSLKLPKDAGKTVVETHINRLRSDSNLGEIADFLIAYVDSLAKIDLVKIKEILELFNAFPNIQDTIKGIDLPSSINCLKTANFDFNGTEVFARFNQHRRDLMDQSRAKEAFELLITAFKTLASTQKELNKAVDGMKASRRRRRRSASGPGAKGLWNLTNSDQLARNLGNGVKALREMSEVFKHQDRVKQVATVSDAVDRVIQSIPNMNTTWTLANKKALENLVDEVNALNTKAGLEKNKNLKRSWKLFEEAQKVNGAPVDVRLFANPIYGALEKHRKYEVRTRAVDFQNFPPLQLDFTSGKRNSLRDSFPMLDTINAFFEGFFAVGTSGQTNIQTNNQPQMQTLADEPSSLFVYIGIGGALLFLIILFVGFFGFRAYRNHKRWENRERFWIYESFREKMDHTTFWCHIVKDRKKDVKKMVNAGKIINFYLENQTPLHLAVDVLSIELVEYLIRHGADTTAESMLHETAEQMTDRMCKMEKLRPSWPELTEISKLFKKYRNKKFEQTIPKLFPHTLFSVVSTCPDKTLLQAFLDKHLGKNIRPAAHYTTATHIVVDVDDQGVYHYQGTTHEDLTVFFYVFFGKQIVVSPKWLQLCLEDNRNFYKDYECRVTKVEFDGKVYSTIDKVKEFARGRHLPFGTGIFINNFTRLRKDLNQHEESVMDLIPDWGFHFKERFKDNRWDYLPLELKPEFKEPFYRPDLKSNWIVYDDESLDNCEHEVAGTKLDDFHIMSYREFTGYLLDLKMTNGAAAQFPIKETKTTKDAITTKSKTNSAPTPTSVASTKPSTSSSKPNK